MTAPAKSIPLKSVAVLPFVNIGNNVDQEYFSDGMAEEIINSLTHLKDLKVAGRTSSFQFKNKDVDLRELGKKLGVSYCIVRKCSQAGQLAAHYGTVDQYRGRLSIVVGEIRSGDGQRVCHSG